VRRIVRCIGSVFAAGRVAQVARVRPLLALFASSIEHVGGCGAGHAVKVCTARHGRPQADPQASLPPLLSLSCQLSAAVPSFLGAMPSLSLSFLFPVSAALEL
jgi:hypothetical protein